MSETAMSAETRPDPAAGPATLAPLALPEGLKAVALDGIERMKKGYEKIAAETEAVEGAVEASCARAFDGGAALGLKMIELMQANMDAGFAFAAEMAEVRSLPDMIELSSRFAARRFEASVIQGKALWTCGQKMMTEAAKPLAAGFSAEVDKAAAT